MSNFRFRCLIDDYLCDITPFKSYVEKGALDAGLILIAFDESEIDVIRKLFKENVRDGQYSYLNNIQLVGNDGYLYIMSQSSVEKKEKMPHSIMRAYRYYKSYKKKQNKANEYIQNEIKNNNDGISKIHGGKFNAYKYTDKNNNMSFPFRLFTTKEKDRPLFVIFHGAGALGNDNIKQHFENTRLYKHILKENCNILSPQAPYGSNRGYDLIQSYIKSVKKLIDELPIDFDRKRIYIVGTSFGGGCVWHISYLFPDYFAAAVPVMGKLFFDNNFSCYDVQRLTKTPLWVAHSSDDTNVTIDSDDYCVDSLQKLGADIKYTRWDKYGHSMSGKFYKTEKWAEWCLSKERK